MPVKPISGLKRCRIVLIAAFCFTRAPYALPLQGGENILFIGNSLTGMLYQTVPALLSDNGLPAFNGHAVQIWNQTLETHWNFTPETHADLCHETAPPYAKGYIVKGACSVWKKGQYDDSSFCAKGYLSALEVIRNGTPDKKSWDYVILQGYSVGDPQNELSVGPDGKPCSDGRFFTYSVKFIDAVREAGAEPLLYENWVVNPDVLWGSAGEGTQHPYWINHSTLTEENYHAISEVKNTPIIPVGEIMHRLSSTLKPNDKTDGWLYRDNVHPNSLGKAMQNYAFAAFFSGVEAESLIGTDTTIAASDDAAIKAGTDRIMEGYSVNVVKPKASTASMPNLTPTAGGGRQRTVFSLTGRRFPMEAVHAESGAVGSQFSVITQSHQRTRVSRGAMLQIRLR